MTSNRIDGGLDTTHLSAQEQDRLAREQRQADALSYLTRKGLDVPDANGVNLAEVLGLVEGPKPQRPAKSRKES